MISLLGHILFVVAVALMFWANNTYEKRIATPHVPGRYGPNGKAIWYEGKIFRLRSQLGLLLIIGAVILLGVHLPTQKTTNLEWWLLGYSVLAPVFHIAYLRHLYHWSLRQ